MQEIHKLRNLRNDCATRANMFVKAMKLELFTRPVQEIYGTNRPFALYVHKNVGQVVDLVQKNRSEGLSESYTANLKFQFLQPNKHLLPDCTIPTLIYAYLH
jgi:hypothetical protein